MNRNPSNTVEMLPDKNAKAKAKQGHSEVTFPPFTAKCMGCYWNDAYVPEILLNRCAEYSAYVTIQMGVFKVVSCISRPGANA